MSPQAATDYNAQSTAALLQQIAQLESMADELAHKARELRDMARIGVTYEDAEAVAMHAKEMADNYAGSISREGRRIVQAAYDRASDWE